MPELPLAVELQALRCGKTALLPDRPEERAASNQG